MTAFESHRLLITPISPVHIGTGESFQPTNYVIDDGILHEFDTGAVAQALPLKDRDTLLAIANRKPDAELLRAMQRFFYERREALMGWAVVRVPVLPGVANLYADRVGQVANQEARGSKVLNRLEIDRTGYCAAMRTPALYGSSVKGAIRTALLDKVNAGRPAEKEDKDGLHRFQGRLFKYLNEGRRPVLELDPMRLVHISDASWQGEPRLPATQVYLAVNRKKAPVRDEQGNLRRSRAESGDLYQILECVPGWRYGVFAAQLNVQRVAGLPDRNRKEQRLLPAKDLRFGIDEIARACNAFYKPILDEENRLMRERGYLDSEWDKSVTSLIAAAREKMESGRAFLLRVGRHCGADAVTLRGVRSIRIMGAKDPQTGKTQSTNATSAKTVWLAAEDKDQATSLLPFGWLMVEVQPLAVAPSEWPEFKSLCEPRLAQARSFANRIADQQARLQQGRAKAEAARREEEETARRAADEALRRAREEQDRHARLKAMSPNMRRVEEFIAVARQRMDQLRGGKEKMNAAFHTRARDLARDAIHGQDWTAEEKRAAADGITEWLPRVVERIDKDQLKKLKLSSLR